MKQGNLFGDEPKPDGKKLRDDGMKRAENHAPEWWKIECREKIRLVANGKPEFTSDDIWATGLKKPREPRALGAMINKARIDEEIEATDRFIPSKQPQRHRGPMRVWKKKRQ